jgi:hypothetical protein
MAGEPPKGTKGKPPGWLVDPDLDGPLLQDVKNVGTRGRVEIPLRLAGGAQWLTAGGEGLMVLGLPGRLALRPWTDAQRVIQRRRELVERAHENAEAIRVIDDRYRKYHLDSDGRIELQPFALSHLDPNRELLYVALIRYESHLEIWAMRERGDALQRPIDDLEGLP